MATEEGNVDPELVARIEAEIFELTGSQLEDLLNPSKAIAQATTFLVHVRSQSEMYGVSPKTNLWAAEPICHAAQKNIP